LRYFVTVADEGQITRAARKLHLAQPSLSQAISQLETEVGFKLLERHTHGVTLTPAGQEFYEKARTAVAADMDAARTASALARAEQGVIHFGFLGAPPGLDSPARLQAFSSRHPHIDICYREIRFPSSPTSAWLSDVDVAVCHRPPADPNVWTHTLRREPRVVLAPAHHHLAERGELSVAELLEETFIGLDRSIDPDWAGFWSLDDHRGATPAQTTNDQATNPQEVLAALATRRAITTVPASVAAVVANVLTRIVAIPLRDAEPSAITLVGHADLRNPLVKALRSFAREP
jgi:DNA-binding transcriptional LysR family regulator